MERNPLTGNRRLRYKLKHPERILVGEAKRRATRDGVPFDITEHDITIPLVCPVLGIPMQRGMGRATDNSPSIDRVVPALGYVRGNVIVVSNRANRLKGDATLGEMGMLFEFYKKLKEVG